MPNCQDCGGDIAFTPKGSKCIACGKVYNQIETIGLDGFNPLIARLAIDLMIGLVIQGVPTEDIDEVHVLEEGLIVKFRQDS